MALVDSSRSLAELVTESPARARVFERHGLDYCCHGGQSLADACGSAGVDPDAVLASLRETGPAPAPWAGAGIGALLDHIEATHHAYLRDELPRLDALFDRVIEAHRERHPELLGAQATFRALRADLEPHMLKEERILFPACRALAESEAPLDLPFGTVGNPISVMEQDHDAVGELLERLREQTDGYRPPDDACASYRSLYEGLDELAADTHLHVHTENNVLFPLVLERERALRR